MLAIQRFLQLLETMYKTKCRDQILLYLVVRILVAVIRELWPPVPWFPVFGYIWRLATVSRWTVGACILGPCVGLDIWTLATVAGGLWVPVSWSPVLGRIFGHLVE